MFIIRRTGLNHSYESILGSSGNVQGCSEIWENARPPCHSCGQEKRTLVLTCFINSMKPQSINPSKPYSSIPYSHELKSHIYIYIFVVNYTSTELTRF